MLFAYVRLVFVSVFVQSVVFGNCKFDCR